MLPAGQSDAFPDDPEHAAVVLAPEIRFERLGVAHEEVAFVCMPLPKIVKSTVQVDVVDDQHAARAERLPRVVELEEDVAPAVPAVVNEEIDRRQSRQQPRESPPTRTADVPPPRPQALSHRNAGSDHGAPETVVVEDRCSKAARSHSVREPRG